MAALTKEKLDQIRKSTDVALAKIAKEFGLASYECRTVKFDNLGHFKIGIQGRCSGVLSKEALVYQDAYEFSLIHHVPSDMLVPLGSKFWAQGCEFTITGMNKVGQILATEPAYDGWILFSREIALTSFPGAVKG